ncbi:MAG: hypothetical protein FWH55_12310 [Oscillospiraceae bacterium]|nr:hypothetical protein [Oscillospiraceae bacterium]
MLKRRRGPAYKALLIYQDIMPLGSAKKILEWVEAGLPVVIADGGKELISGTMQGVNLWKTNAKAAAYSPFNDQNDPNDSELATVMNQLRNHKNVRVVDSQDKALEALRDLNVYPRADFDKENRNVITLMRDTDDTLYLYAYNFMYDHFDETQYYTTYDSNGDAIDEADYVHPEPYTITFAIEGLGKPYLINCWTNDITEIGEYEVKGGKTYVTLTLLPGEATFIALDKNNTNYLYVTDTDADRVIMSDGSMAIVATESGTYTTKLNNSSEITTVITVPDNISLPLWNLTVEDWNAGEKKTRTEDRPAGFQGPGTLAYTTTEVYFETTKTPIAVGETALVPWKDIPSVGPNVSGVGYYSTSFELPKNWADNNGAYLKIGSAHGNTVAVYVNGKKAPAVDLQNLTVEVTDLLQPGTNTLEAEVSSSLRNRLLQRGGLSGNLTLYRVPAPYGMTGDVELVTYTVAPIKSNVLASIRSDEANVGLGAPASYTVSLSEAMGAGVVTLSFTADSRFLDLNSATALNGFSIVDPLAWEYIGSQLWNGTVKLYCPGFVQSNDLLDILKISGVARDLLGDTTVTLTNITITGDMFGFSGDMQSLIVTAEAETSIVSKTVFSKYDLNHDGRIDELDLAIVVYYYLANDLEADWDVVKFDIASAKDCDVAVNGRVDLADMIEVIANYCDSY